MKKRNVQDVGFTHILNAVTNSINNKRNLFVVCNKVIADMLIDFMEILDFNCDEVFLGEDDIQYFQLYFDEYDEDELEIYCEDARGYDGNLKLSDIGHTDYILCTNISPKIVEDTFSGEDITIEWCDVACTFYDLDDYDYDYDEECICNDCDCDCEELEECDCEDCQLLDEIIDECAIDPKDVSVLKLLDKYAERIVFTTCQDCARELLLDFAYEGGEILKDE